MKIDLLAILLLTFFQFTFLFAQQHDQVWFTGGYNTEIVGEYEIDFSTHPLTITNHDVPSNFDALSSTFCNYAGELFSYTNGVSIWNKNHEIMEGGDTINPGPNRNFWRGNGLRLPKGAFFLPMPGQEDSLLYLFHASRDYPLEITPPDSFSTASINVAYYTIIDQKANNGLGRVVSANIPYHIEDISPPIAVRHANGRDWWILIALDKENKYYSYLLTPDGLQSPIEKEIGTKNHYKELEGIVNIQEISKNGTKYIDYSGVYGFSLYDFDRCSGDISNEYRLDFIEEDTTGWTYDAEFSLNNRYLYVSLLWATTRFGIQPYGGSNPLIIQYDLLASDLELSADTVGVNDTLPNPPYPIRGIAYGGLQTGVDGKIYSFNGGLKTQSIQEPNRKGKNCRVRHRFPWTEKGVGISYPNYPNYRLGPIDESPCDTLGLDNHPRANYRWENWDTLNDLHIEFADLSYYEPAEWFWDFEDLGTSRDTNPEFTFPAPGIYKVCLTVSNVNSTHTTCKNVPVGEGVVDIDYVFKENEPTVYPNPTFNAFQVYLPTSQSIDVQLFDASGRQVLEQSGVQSGEQIDVSFLPKGIYFYHFRNEKNEVIHTGRLVVVR